MKTETTAMIQMLRQALGLADEAPITIEALEQLLQGDDATPQIVLAVASYAVDELAAAQAQVAALESAMSNAPRLATQAALSCLSYSELEAIQAVFHDLDGDAGLLVASRIADKVGLTRSVIVCAIRKLEAGGVVASRSLGMRGTHIKILIPELREELRKLA